MNKTTERYRLDVVDVPSWIVLAERLNAVHYSEQVHSIIPHREGWIVVIDTTPHQRP